MELTATNRSRAWPKGQGRKWYNSSHVVPELENFMLAWEFDSSAKRRERTIMNKTELRSNESTKCGFVNVRLWTEVLRMKSLCAVLKVQWNIKVEIPFKGGISAFFNFLQFFEKSSWRGHSLMLYYSSVWKAQVFFFMRKRPKSLLIYYDGGGDCASKDHIGMYGLQAA